MIPISIIKIPLSIDTIGRYFENFLNCFEKLPIAMAVKINGTARPREYITRSKIPLYSVSILVAYISMEDKIGPIHGVQPDAKAIPIRIGLNLP